MNYTISLILDVVYYETSERYCSDLDDMSQVSFCVFFEHRGSVNFELGIVQVKQRFLQGNTQKGARQGAGVSSHGMLFSLVLCLLCFLVCDWCEHRDV